jgi:hypothetical protein
VAAYQCPRWEERTTEHSPGNERGDGSHLGGMARRASGSGDASLRATATWSGSWGPEREYDEVPLFWLGEGEQRSSPKRENGGGSSVEFRREWRLFGTLDRCTGFAERGGRGCRRASVSSTGTE